MVCTLILVQFERHGKSGRPCMPHYARNDSLGE